MNILEKFRPLIWLSSKLSVYSKQDSVKSQPPVDEVIEDTKAKAIVIFWRKYRVAEAKNARRKRILELLDNFEIKKG